MKLKLLVLGSILVAAIAAIAVTRTLSAARSNLVSLDVRETPLVDVLASLARQTRENIVADKTLDTKITLSVKRAPLADVLDQIAQQAGANWIKYHAVHDSVTALTRLTAALQNRAPVESAGWTNIAPYFEPPPGSGDLAMRLGEAPAGEAGATGGQRRIIVQNSGPVVMRREAAPGEAGVPQVVENDVDVRIGGPGATLTARHEGAHGQSHGARPTMRMVTMTRDASGKMTQEVWSPETITLETRLRPKLGDETYSQANEDVAKEIATKVKGQRATLYVLRKMPGGFSLPPGLMGAHGRQIFRQGGPGTSTNADGSMPPLPDVETMVRRSQAENYTKLTPEQRARRAQERQAANPKP